MHIATQTQQPQELINSELHLLPPLAPYQTRSGYHWYFRARCIRGRGPFQSSDASWKIIWFVFAFPSIQSTSL